MSTSKKRDITTLQLRPSTRDALKRKKRGGESYDEMFRRRFRL